MKKFIQKYHGDKLLVELDQLPEALEDAVEQLEKSNPGYRVIEVTVNKDVFWKAREDGYIERGFIELIICDEEEPRVMPIGPSMELQAAEFDITLETRP